MKYLKKKQPSLICFALVFLFGCTQSTGEKEQIILNSLEYSLEEYKRQNEYAVDALKKKVAREGNSAEGREAIRRAEIFVKKRTALVNFIELIKKHLIEKSGGRDTETGLLTHPGASSIFAKDEFIVAGKKLKEYMFYITTEFRDIISPDALQNLGSGLSEEETFYQSFFRGTSVIQALSILTERQKAVLRYEQEILKRLGAGDLSHALRFDRPIILPDPLYEPAYGNEFKTVLQSPLSTFSIDVDHASYTLLRKTIQNNEDTWRIIPDYMRQQLRIEEMINYFSYKYPEPKPNDKHPFSVSTEYADCPWNPSTKLLKIGIQGKKIHLEKRPPSNIVFLLDVSGSMYGSMQLLKNSFKLIVEQLTPKDKVSIVVYAGAAGLVLPPTAGNEKSKIIKAFDKLEAGGSTAGGEGILLAYKMAQESFLPNGNNRIILATDGDFNVGLSNLNDLENLIAEKRKSGVYLTCMGFGNHYRDDIMEILADKGNGNYGYIDTMSEAEKMLVREYSGTLFTIAKDVKIQIDFNPVKVHAYRLLGYENRRLDNRDFGDDTKDAGELGAGHQVTALYEIVPNAQANANIRSEKLEKTTYYTLKSTYTEEALEGDLLTLKLRYKFPKSVTSKLIIHRVSDEYTPLSQTSNSFRFASAVAGCGMYIKSHEFISKEGFYKLIKQAKKAKGTDKGGYKKEFIELMTKLK